MARQLGIKIVCCLLVIVHAVTFAIVLIKIQGMPKKKKVIAWTRSLNLIIGQALALISFFALPDDEIAPEIDDDWGDLATPNWLKSFLFLKLWRDTTEWFPFAYLPDSFNWQVTSIKKFDIAFYEYWDGFSCFTNGLANLAFGFNTALFLWIFIGVVANLAASECNNDKAITAWNTIFVIDLILGASVACCCSQANPSGEAIFWLSLWLVWFSLALPNIIGEILCEWQWQSTLIFVLGAVNSSMCVVEDWFEFQCCDGVCQDYAPTAPNPEVEIPSVALPGENPEAPNPEAQNPEALPAEKPVAQNPEGRDPEALLVENPEVEILKVALPVENPEAICEETP